MVKNETKGKQKEKVEDNERNWRCINNTVPHA